MRDKSPAQLNTKTNGKYTIKHYRLITALLALGITITYTIGAFIHRNKNK